MDEWMNEELGNLSSATFIPADDHYLKGTCFDPWDAVQQ